MIRRIHRLAPLALSLALVASACKEKGTPDTLSQDSTLNRDLQLANRDSSAQPQLQDAPPAAPSAPAETKAPSTPRPRPRPTPAAPAAPAPSQPAKVTTPSGNTEEKTAKGSESALGTIPAGTTLNLSSNDRVCTNTNKAGDRFSATVRDAVVGSNGAVIPAGAKVLIEVAELKRSGNANQPITMTFSVLSVSYNGKSYPIAAQIDSVDVEKVRNASTGSDATKVIGGAVIGAIIGQVIGHNTKGTVIGAATGAAAGTAVAMGTAAYEGCVPTGGLVRVKLSEPATVAVQ